MRLPVQARPVDRRGIALVGSRRYSEEERRAITASDSCSVCQDVLAGVIYAAATEATCFLGCTAVGIAAGAACEAAFAGPEDPVGDAVCPVVDASVDAICESAGCDSLRSWSGAQAAALQICKQVNIC